MNISIDTVAKRTWAILVPEGHRRSFLAVLILVAILGLLASYVFVRNLDEYYKSLEFVETSTAVRDNFGAIEQVSLVWDGGIRYRGDAKSGFFTFKVTGTKRNGKVSVHWESKSDGSDFHVTSITQD
ncbi:MAG: hypothetical protein IT365_06420 [Candidatus Hydrogenedentes bacterium]|nr:hypothetical protein [Candidatus Hydrogenedentota bacterium]